MTVRLHIGYHKQSADAVDKYPIPFRRRHSKNNIAYTEDRTGGIDTTFTVHAFIVLEIGPVKNAVNIVKSGTFGTFHRFPAYFFRKDVMQRPQQVFIPVNAH